MTEEIEMILTTIFAILTYAAIMTFFIFFIIEEIKADKHKREYLKSLTAEDRLTIAKYEDNTKGWQIKRNKKKENKTWQK